MATEEQAAETLTAEPPDAEDAESTSPDQSGRRARQLKIAGILVVLTVVMMAVGYAFMPPPPEKDEQPSNVLDENVDLSDGAEVEIGEFNITKADAGIIVHVRFRLWVLVSEAQRKDFKDAKDSYQHRLRQEVIRIIRGASMDDLNASDHGTIKGLMREGINRVLRVSYVKEILISDWTTLER